MDIRHIYKIYKKDIQKRKKEFKKNILNKENILKELFFCILTPQSKAIKCWQAVCEIFSLDEKKFNYDNVEKILSKKVRFYRNKAKYLIEAKKKFEFIYKLIKNKKIDPLILREILIKEIKGLGYKEASHFIRNIGYSFELAILDRHILKNLKELKVIKKIPKTLSKKSYLEIEKKFSVFSKKINIPMVDLDLTFWAKQTGYVFK